MSGDYTPERAVAIVDRIITLQDQRDDIELAIDNLKLKLASLYDDTPGDYEESGRKITVYFHKAFNKAHAEANEPELVKKGSEEQPVFTAATAKKLLTPEEYARVQKVSTTPSVKIELLED